MKEIGDEKRFAFGILPIPLFALTVEPPLSTFYMTVTARGWSGGLTLGFELSMASLVTIRMERILQIIMTG